MGLMYWSLNNQWQGQSDAAIDYTGRWKLLLHATQQFYAPMLLHIHAGWDTEANTGWNETNITTGACV
jgi:beta-galactosidase/beta-glucuronidase